MRQCVRCGKSCQATFCDDCRSFLRKELQKGSVAYQDVSTYTTSPVPVARNLVTPLPPINDQYKKLMEQLVQPGENDPVTPLPLVSDLYTTQAEQAIQNLQDAARRIEAVEQREHHGPRVSRLSPWRDISADIQRKSTPLPGAWSK